MAFSLETHRQRVDEARRHDVWFGTSSWKYPGWKGLLYKDTYKSDRDFERRCLSEYARTYPCVGVDHTYYDWPKPATFARYVDATPDHFLFVLKVTDAITVPRYPRIARYGKRAGTENPDFLRPEAFRNRFLGPLSPYLGRIGALVFEFSRFKADVVPSGRAFLEKLLHFFRELPERADVPLAVEFRNDRWVTPEFYTGLASVGVAPTFNSWTKMPAIDAQLDAARGAPFPLHVVRALLTGGQSYEEAVEAYAPYDRLQSPSEALRESLRKVVRHAVAARRRAIILVNNRAEGCAPLTIDAILEGDVGFDGRRSR